MALRGARLSFRGQILSVSKFRQGPHLLKERGLTWQLSAAVRAGTGRLLCSRIDEAGTGTPGATRDNFPWRQAPPPSRPGLMQRIVQNIVHRRLLRAVADENFMRGAEMAFMTITATLFKLKMSNVRDITERSKDELQADVERHLVTEMKTGPWASGASNAESDEADDSPQLDGIDSELFSFVKRAEDATHGRGAIPYYRLHAIIPPASVSNVLCITSLVKHILKRDGRCLDGVQASQLVDEGAIRGDDISRLEVFNYPGFLHFQDGEVLDERLGTVWSNMEANVEKTMLRVELDFNCFETFFVRDRGTKEIIQGSEEPQLRTHRITLEASPIRPSTVRWKVIDLDDWMDGNRFW